MAAFSPQDRVALATAVAGALVLHAAAIGALSQRPPPQAIDAPVVTTRVIEAPRPPKPEAVAPVVTPPATPRTPSRPRPAPDPETRPVPALLALPLRGDGALAYAFVIDGQPGEAALNFHIGNGRYDITLERRSGDRELPVWHSEGRVGPQGLQPELHRVSRQGRERELQIFDRDAARPVLLVGARAFPLSAGTQDRLSWWLQVAAMMAAEPAPCIGQRLRVPVAGPTGVNDWDFEVIARDGGRWLLRRDLARGAGRPALQWSVWLDGQRGFLAVDLRFSLDDDEQWALRLLE
ncbi:hypothetical protein ACFJIX_05960 [Roseateles sp. UC29_93]|uniref:hypothetical protein n=1 Tax=Roseateles sp. UC29_93 TaxID=3350177 RepID=UPI00366F35C5